MSERIATKPDASVVRLGEAARIAGVTVQQLQYYLLLGVVESSGASEGRQRFFDRQAIRQIRLVKLLNTSGYALNEIRDIFTQGIDPRDRRRAVGAGLRR